MLSAAGMKEVELERSCYTNIQSLNITNLKNRLSIRGWDAPTGNGGRDSAKLLRMENAESASLIVESKSLEEH